MQDKRAVTQTNNFYLIKWQIQMIKAAYSFILRFEFRVD